MDAIDANANSFIVFEIDPPIKRATSKDQSNGVINTIIQNQSSETLGTVTGVVPATQIVLPPKYGENVMAIVIPISMVLIESGNPLEEAHSRQLCLAHFSGGGDAFPFVFRNILLCFDILSLHTK